MNALDILHAIVTAAADVLLYWLCISIVACTAFGLVCYLGRRRREP